MGREGGVVNEVIARLTPTEDGFRDLSLGRELVRCRDCAKSAETPCFGQLLMCCWWARPVERDGFCHEGVRRS